MDATTLKVLAAGLLHDLGKAGTRTTFGIDRDYVERHENVYLPVHHGRYSHHHALFSVAIIEKHSKLFPPEFLRSQWGEGDAFLNLVGGHHNPSSPLQWIVAVADRISSGWDRDIFYKEEDAIAPKEYLRTRLFPLFEHLLVEGDEYVSESDFKYCYPLAPMSPHNIFPMSRDEAQAIGGSKASSYEMLFDEFLESAAKLLHRTENLELWLEHFDSLMMVYLSSIPAARAGKVVPDVSLYDHSRTTAALASALYLYHKATDSLDHSSIADQETNKFLMVSGDLYGIQDFIFTGYGDTRKHRSKLLRGRSLYVSLLTELASDKLCRAMGLHRLSSIMSAAGKFLIVGPNTDAAKDAVDRVAEEINEWLFQLSFGETSLGITHLSASPRDFAERKFQELWDRISLQVEQKKFTKLDLHRHGGVVKGYLDRFNTDLNSPLCPICGKRPSSARVEGREYIDEETQSACELCRDQIFLGTQIVKHRTMNIMSAEGDCGPENLILLEPIFGSYQVTFTQNDRSTRGKMPKLLASWDIRSWERDSLASNVTLKMINGYVPVYEEEDKHDERILLTQKSEEKKLEAIDQIQLGDPKTFAHIAAKALLLDEEKQDCMGVDALGVLKADVDNLGLLMSCGLKAERFTVSRLATLSRQLNTFFAYYLPYKLNNNNHFKDVYTVFGGGDDLFLIGPWNRMLDLAVELTKDFNRYCCDNPQIHLSAGIHYCKANIPLDALATQAEEALDKAKQGQKNQVTVFGETVPWSRMENLIDISQKMRAWYEEGLVTRSMFYKLNEIIHMAAREKQVLSGNEIYFRDMHVTKWRALLSYFAVRNVAKSSPKEEREKKVNEVLGLMAQWLGRHGGSLKIPLWHFLYNTR